MCAQIGENACVYELAQKALVDDSLSETSRRDITLALVAAHCNAARDLFQEAKVGICVCVECDRVGAAAVASQRVTTDLAGVSRCDHRSHPHPLSYFTVTLSAPASPAPALWRRWLRAAASWSRA